MSENFIYPLSDPAATLAEVGGKGASLARLSAAGLPVPDGFHITTKAYRCFVQENSLQAEIEQALEAVDLARPSTLETASKCIQERFLAGCIPPEIAEAVIEAYAALPGQNLAVEGPALPVAVRSSATAEDLPEASFAGQQETYLNVSGPEAVLEATRKCWASLWTARAIGYRARQNIPSDQVALAVVVQALIPAEAAGILFTANPVNGRRDQAVISASWGLGEAVVGGAVTPDSLILDKASGQVVSRDIADKQVMTVRSTGGTVEQPVPEHLRRAPVLDDREAAELYRLGVQIEALYEMPMDIEWALAGGEFTILQARPVTTLGEAPLVWTPPDPKGVYMRTSVVDLMPDPLSPLFATLGIPTLVAQMYPIGKYVTRMDPILPEGYFTTINNYAYMNAHFSPRAWFWILFGLLPSYPRMLRMVIPFWRDEARPRYRKAVAGLREKDIEQMTCSELLQSTQAIMNAAAYYTSALMFATMGASAGSEALLTKVHEKIARREGDPPANVLLMGWDNLPIRAEKSLYDLARFCREHESLGAYVLETPSCELVESMTGEQVPAGVEAGSWQEFHQRFDQHLQEFGHMVFELDFAKPLPRDHPEPMLEVIKMYLHREGTDPYERQKASEERRIHTGQEMLGRLKGIKRWVFTKALNWAQSLAEVREDALADIGLGYPIMRRLLHALGERFVKAGALPKAGDIFWLKIDEVEKAAAALDEGRSLENMFALVEQRKAFWQKARRATPPPMLPPRKKYLGFNTSVWVAESEENQARDMLKGVPASPGRVTAPARVLHGPEEFDQMRAGDVLVAGTTTPAWTPLFAMASAIVTDIGGPLSHGSIVAREYGIPAVMGTGVATRRILSGHIITVDGSAGTVVIS